jgi:hypothetical protein
LDDSVKLDDGLQAPQKLWDSGIGLSAWLACLSAAEDVASQPVLVQELRNRLFVPQEYNTIELGPHCIVSGNTSEAVETRLQVLGLE